MDEQTYKELGRLHKQIESLAHEERFGPNHQEFRPQISRFESLVNSFYEIAAEQELPIGLMHAISDGRNSLNRNFMALKSDWCTDKFSEMKSIFQELDHIMRKIDSNN